MKALKGRFLTAGTLGLVTLSVLGISSAQAAVDDGNFLISAVNEDNPEIIGQAGRLSSDGGEVTPPDNIEAPQPNLTFDLGFTNVSWSGDPDNKCEVVDGYCTYASGPGWGGTRADVTLNGIPQQWIDGVKSGTFSVELKSGAELTDGEWTHIVKENGTPLTKAEYQEILPGGDYAAIQTEINNRLNSNQWDLAPSAITPSNPLRMASESWKFKFDSSTNSLSIRPPLDVLETRFAEALDAQTNNYVYNGNMTTDSYTITVASNLVVTDLASGERKTFPIDILIQLPL